MYTFSEKIIFCITAPSGVIKASSRINARNVITFEHIHKVRTIGHIHVSHTYIL